MNFLERFFALILIIVVTACGTAKFQGKGGSKDKNVDDRSSEPVVCGEANPCPNPCESKVTLNTEESVSQNAASSAVGQNPASATCPAIDPEDDATQNGDHSQS